MNKFGLDLSGKIPSKFNFTFLKKNKYIYLFRKLFFVFSECLEVFHGWY